jgi:hypothetical protein
MIVLFQYDRAVSFTCTLSTGSGSVLNHTPSSECQVDSFTGINSYNCLLNLKTKEKQTGLANNHVFYLLAVLCLRSFVAFYRFHSCLINWHLVSLSIFTQDITVFTSESIMR